MRLALIAVLLLSGCGLDDYTPKNFQGAYECTIEGGTFVSEMNVDCDRVRYNLALAKTYVTEILGYEWKFHNLRIRHWNRQLLACHQWFLGICVYPIKGLSRGSTIGQSLQMIELNNGGELLLHELMHYLEDDADHKMWPYNGFRRADADFRWRAKLLVDIPRI